MNKMSYICNYINENKNWKESIKENYDITVKEDGNYAIFNYGIKSDFTNPLVQEARGIIIDTTSLNVACWPFRKFGNYTEDYADTIDWSTARVQDKIDGSIIKVWYDNSLNEWVISTNSTIYAKNAIANDNVGCKVVSKSFLEIVESADNYADIDFSLLNKRNTYIFELTSPYNQVVIYHEITHLYHIGTRDNVTGQEYNEDIGIEKPAEYKIGSLEDCIIAAEKLNKDIEGNICDVSNEGYVVVDANWHRIKIKSPDYIMLHHLVANFNVSKERLVHIIRSGEVDIESMCKSFPKTAHYLRYYAFKVCEFEKLAKTFCDLTLRIYKQSGRDRKAVAIKIKNHRYASLGFASLGPKGAESNTEYNFRNIIDALDIRAYCKFIPDYEPERIAEVFYGKENTELGE